jgi:hypothetical protein
MRLAAPGCCSVCTPVTLLLPPAPLLALPFTAAAAVVVASRTALPLLAAAAFALLFLLLCSRNAWKRSAAVNGFVEAVVLVLDPALVVSAVSEVDVSGISVLASSAPPSVLPLVSSVKAPSSPCEPSELGCLKLCLQYRSSRTTAGRSASIVRWC